MKRELPDFVVIGSPRCGTTSLYHLLHQVPQICLTDFKESDYFIEELNFSKGAAWYDGLFSEPHKICGDISPNYSSHGKFNGVPERLFAKAPNAKIFYIVRDTAQRTRSHYQQLWTQRQDMPDPADVFDTAIGKHILECSSYMFQIEAYLEFFPKDRIHILRFEDLKEQPKTVVETVCKALNINITEAELAAISAENRNSSQNLADAADWWQTFAHRMRRNDSAFVRRVTKLVPRSLINGLKSTIARKSATERILPEFTPEIDAQVADRLAADQVAFDSFVAELATRNSQI